MGSSFMSSISTLGWGVIGYVIPFLFVLTVVVFFHELGHFLVARWNGVRVLVFSIGFGPELFGFNDRHGTRWKLSAIPLGGYVKFFGDENAASVPDRDAAAAMNTAERKESFVHQAVGPRAAIVVAGPVANFILAIVIFAALFMLFGKQSTAARVESIQPESAAAAAGFQPGDLVISINGRSIESFSEMQRIVSTSAGDTLTIEVERGGTRVTLKAVPALKEVKDNFGNVHRLGVLGISRSIAPSEVKMEPVGPVNAVWLGVKETWNIVETTISYIGRIVVGRDNADQLGGPIMIAQVSGQVATLGVAAIMHFVAVLSVSIGLLNLFPVPLLDGGHLLFYAAEFIRGRPLSERAQEIGFRIGFVLVAALMVFATKNDIFRIWNWAAS
jgi:regulator of sigma E protease